VRRNFGKQRDETEVDAGRLIELAVKQGGEASIACELRDAPEDGIGEGAQAGGVTILAVAERGIAFPVGLDKTEEQAGVEHNRIE
jgi:hypothetical protein